MARRSKRGTSPIDTLVGQNLRAMRSQRGMSQSALGDLLDLTFQQIQKYEKGTNRIAASTLYEMARIFGVPLDAFFQGADEIVENQSGGMPPQLSTQALKLAVAYDTNDNHAFKKAVTSLFESMGRDESEAA